jgi:hypothetical protein
MHHKEYAYDTYKDEKIRIVFFGKLVCEHVKMQYHKNRSYADNVQYSDEQGLLEILLEGSKEFVKQKTGLF